MFVRSSIPGNAAAAKLRDLSHAEMRYVTASDQPVAPYPTLIAGRLG
jgi:hypothetical protein